MTHLSKFPFVLFLCVPPTRDREERGIAFILEKELSASCVRYFRSPLHDGLNGMFYEGNPSIEMAHPEAIIPFKPTSAKLFYPRLEHLMKDHFGADIMALMLYDWIKSNSDNFDFVIVPDAYGRPHDMRSLATRVGRANCTIVNIEGERMFVGDDGVKTLTLKMSGDMTANVDALIDEYAKLHAPKEQAND